MKIIIAQNTDAKRVTELTLRSKMHWNYTENQMKQWIDELTISPKYIKENQIYLLFSNDQLAGYYSLISQSDITLELDNLFVDPVFIGKGLGTILMNDAIERSIKMEIEKIVLYADPNAEKFYMKFGFVVVGKHKTTIKNRFLAIMELVI